MCTFYSLYSKLNNFRLITSIFPKSHCVRCEYGSLFLFSSRFLSPTFRYIQMLNVQQLSQLLSVSIQYTDTVRSERTRQNCSWFLHWKVPHQWVERKTCIAIRQKPYTERLADSPSKTKEFTSKSKTSIFSHEANPNVTARTLKKEIRS